MSTKESNEASSGQERGRAEARVAEREDQVEHAQEAPRGALRAAGAAPIGHELRSTSIRHVTVKLLSCCKWLLCCSVLSALFSLHCSICPVLYVLVCLSHCCLLWRRSCDCRAFAFRSSSGGYADVQVGEHGAARQGGEGQPPVFVAEQSSLRLSDIFRVVFVCSIDQLSFVKLRSGKARLRTNSFFFSLFFFLFFFFKSFIT